MDSSDVFALRLWRKKRRKETPEQCYILMDDINHRENHRSCGGKEDSAANLCTSRNPDSNHASNQPICCTITAPGIISTALVLSVAEPSPSCFSSGESADNYLLSCESWTSNRLRSIAGVCSMNSNQLRETSEDGRNELVTIFGNPRAAKWFRMESMW